MALNEQIEATERASGGTPASASAVVAGVVAGGGTQLMPQIEDNPRTRNLSTCPGMAGVQLANLDVRQLRHHFSCAFRFFSCALLSSAPPHTCAVHCLVPMLIGC